MIVDLCLLKAGNEVLAEPNKQNCAPRQRYKEAELHALPAAWHATASCHSNPGSCMALQLNRLHALGLCKACAGSLPYTAGTIQRPLAEATRADLITGASAACALRLALRVPGSTSSTAGTAQRRPLSTRGQAPSMGASAACALNCAMHAGSRSSTAGTTQMNHPGSALHEVKSPARAPRLLAL